MHEGIRPMRPALVTTHDKQVRSIRAPRPLTCMVCWLHRSKHCGGHRGLYRVPTRVEGDRSGAEERM